MMESNRECNEPRRRSGRRSSLFTPQGNSAFSILTQDMQYIYPSEYEEQLKSELELWKIEREKFDTMISEKNEKLISKPLAEEEILTGAQQDFLSTLSGYNQYIKCVHDFSNRFAIAVEKLSVKTEQFLNHEKSIEDTNREVLNLCKTRF